ncbi:MAG: FkbM family methyltransferase [Verrucomicrobiota bacterium]
MIEHRGVLIHLDPKSDRVADAEFTFEGWVAAYEPVRALWLLGLERTPLSLCDRPDVRRVFPGRRAWGFAAKVKVSGDALRFGVELGDEIFEVEHPLPHALPARSWRERMMSQLILAWLRLRERLASNPSRRWRFVLRRHLVLREQRSNVFQRRHTDALLSDFAAVLPEAVFVQIGANDGYTGDPIYPLLTRPGSRWRGVLVEPVADLFAQLSQRYAHLPALHLEQAAIGESDGNIVIHHLGRREGDNLWLQQLASLDPELLRENARRLGLDEVVTISETVPCLTVASLLRRHGLTKLDLIAIDTEGMDWNILRQFDLEKLRPKLILYEHQHLSVEEREQLQALLARHNYGWVETPEGDTLSWKQV